MNALEKKGHRAIRFNCDCFPADIQISQTIGNKTSDSLWMQGQTEVKQEDIAAVWLRKNCLPGVKLALDDGQPHPMLEQCVRESEAAKNIYLNNLNHVPWIDPIQNIEIGEDKGRQLRLAVVSGLTIPETLITNSPKDVLAFYDANRGEIVTKMLTPLTTSMGRPHAFVYTSRVNEEHLKALDGLQYAPMVFQREIEKAYELRVAYVDGKCFSGKICTRKASDKTQVDWRQAQADECQWEPHDLAPEVCHNLQQFMQNMGLSFGAIDLIVTPDGQTVFLEVNPCGEWGMLEKFLDLPISQAIADALINKITK